MSKHLFVAIAAAALLGAIGSAGPAEAMPLGATAQSNVQFDGSLVTPVGSHKKRHRGPSVSFGVTVPGMYPGIYFGTYHHPYIYIDQGAPYHCHKWNDKHGHRQKVCHRHW